MTVQRHINAAFAEQYGLPIYACIADWRLNEASVGIRDSDVALKVLADRLGSAAGAAGLSGIARLA